MVGSTRNVELPIMEKWEPQDVFDYWKKVHGHKYLHWPEVWSEQFINHPAMKTITSVDASWIREGIDRTQYLDAVKFEIIQKLKLEAIKNDPSGLYSADERGWW